MRKLLIIALLAGGGWYYYNGHQHGAPATAAHHALTELEDIAAKARLKAEDLPLSERNVLPHAPASEKIYHCKDKDGSLVISNLACESQGLHNTGKARSAQGTVSHYAPPPVSEVAKPAAAPTVKRLTDAAPDKLGGDNQ